MSTANGQGRVNRHQYCTLMCHASCPTWTSISPFLLNFSPPGLLSTRLPQRCVRHFQCHTHPNLIRIYDAIHTSYKSSLHLNSESSNLFFHLRSRRMSYDTFYRAVKFFRERERRLLYLLQEEVKKQTTLQFRLVV
jgi:hypothetical protein